MWRRTFLAGSIEAAAAALLARAAVAAPAPALTDPGERKRRHALSPARPHRREGLGDRPRRLPHRPAEGREGEHPHHPHRHRRGINFMDNCWDYHDGGSEVRMGKALRDGYREKVFLMTKIDGRTKEAAAEQIDESLQRLQTDVIDLMQHPRGHPPGGPRPHLRRGRRAWRRCSRRKKAGKIRFIGFTGHKDPLVHLRMLERGGAARLPLRHRADAAQRDGRPLPQLRAAGAARAGQGGHRRARHEVDGRRHHPQEQDGDRRSSACTTR